MYFSASKGAFYDERLKSRYVAAGNWPTDAMGVSAAVYAQFSGSAPAGKRLGAVDGRPGWVDAPAFADADSVLRAVVRRIDTVTRQITGPVPEDEKTSWPLKALAAKAVKAGAADAMQTEMLAREADETGETVEALADMILGRTEQYASAIAALTGIRRRVAAALPGAGDAAALTAIADGAFADIDAVLALALAAQAA